MRYKGFLLLALVCALLLTSVHVYAGTGKRIATAGAMELLIPVGARSTALSGANLAAVSGIDAMYWNPAGVAITNQRAEAMFSHLQWIGDINVNYLAGVTSLGDLGKLGLNIKSLDFGDINETTVESPEGTGSTFSPNYLTIGLTFSRKMTDRIVFGVNSKLVSEKIMSVSATGFAFDFGLQYVSPVSGIKLGVALMNFGTNMKYGGSGLETRVVLPNTESGTVQSSVAVPVAKFDLPSQLKLGVAYDLDLSEENNLELMGSFINNAYAYDQYILGGEYNFKGIFFLRGSYALAYREGLENISEGFTSSSEDFLFGPSFGGGLKLNVGTGMALNLDYAYQTTEFFDNNQWFSLTFGF
jgi:hypothetical protein